MSQNPYAAPKAQVADETLALKTNFIPGGRTVETGRGWSWIAEGWELFRRAPGIWIAIVIVLAVIFMVIGIIPFVGSLATMVLGPIFTGGLMLGCRALEEGHELEFGHLFAGFKEHLGTLAAIGALYLAAMVAVILVTALVTGVGVAAFFGGAQPEGGDPGAVLATAGIVFLVILALTVPLLMAIWLAAPLAVFQGLGAFEAMKQSFMGCLKNILPFLVYGVVMLVAAVVATVPLLLGWLVLGPVMAASVYTAYRDIYLS